MSAEEFNTKTHCWICKKGYTDHTAEDWERCTAENDRRGKVIKKLSKLVGVDSG